MLKNIYKKKLSNIAVFLFMICSIIYLISFNHLEKISLNYNMILSNFDYKIPFVEYFVIPYIVWFPYVGISFYYFYKNDIQEFYKLCFYIFTGMFISLIIFRIFPSELNLRVVIDAQKNIYSKIINYIYLVDTPTNTFPSIHVYNSLVVNYILNKNNFKKFTKYLSNILMILICLSTMFIKQHSIYDVIFAFLLFIFIKYCYNYLIKTTYYQEKLIKIFG